ncbi:MAG: M3 family oligoendopeptidase, partial [Ruthenibacterium lactatiformans]
AWFDAHRAELDELYDKLVKNRTAQARKLGYENFIPLGAIRMRRIGYTLEDMAAYRAQIKKDFVPVVAELKKLQYARTGVADPKFYDDAFCFADGNPAPHGTPEEILAAGREMYHALSPETAEFIDEMFDGGLFDVLSKEGKAPGGYCTYLADYKAPFIFSNFNGTSDDVDVLTHEAGHAFAAWVAARKHLPMILEEPGMESCEIHSMSMEFLTAEHHEKFFGTDTPRYELAHAEDAMYFLPYGTMVDEFQHIMYAEPDLTPGERNAVWAKLESEYRPWLDFAGLPFYGRGAGWQRQLHIYEVPFYYIDYCLAQTVALQFFTAFLHDKKDAWRRYLALVGEAGGKTYPGLVAAAGLDSPFAPGTLAKLGKEVGAWIAAQDAALNAR